MAVSGVNNNTANTLSNASKLTGNNLSSDSFLKLLVEQLKNQDPTKPTDTDKILSQTADLTAVGSSERVAKSMDKFMQYFDQKTNLNAIAYVGKLARIHGDTLSVKASDKDKGFYAYIRGNYKDGEVVIKDKGGKVVRTMQFNDGDAGMKSFKWDLKNDSGNKVPAGNYRIEVNFHNKDLDQKDSIMPGLYPIASVSLDGKKPKVRIQDSLIEIEKVKEVTNIYSDAEQRRMNSLLKKSTG